MQCQQAQGEGMQRKTCSKISDPPDAFKIELSFSCKQMVQTSHNHFLLITDTLVQYSKLPSS